MAEILETIMLICFGFSWPMSVYKNIKAKSANAMSLGFIVMIATGYLSGILAKICMHRINFVLIVYVINLIMVSINLVVYFINKNYDKKEGDLDEKLR